MLASAREGLKRAVQQAPGNSDCWAMLSLMLSTCWARDWLASPPAPRTWLRASASAAGL